MSIFTWILRATDMSEEEKARHLSSSAQAGDKNVDIVERAFREGRLNKRQYRDALDEARNSDERYERQAKNQGRKYPEQLPDSQEEHDLKFGSGW